MAGIYIHIPFCKQACHYCDFHFSTSLKHKDELISAIKKELLLQKNYLEDDVIETIYFGGGTPSLLKADEIKNLVATIFENYRTADQLEITLEANPDDLTDATIKELKGTAINRFSIGIQSFFDEDLKWMNRVHIGSEADSAIKRSQDAGFENLTIDLIYGYPLLSDEKWMHNITQAIDLQIPHLSCYSLTVEPKTALDHHLKIGKQQALDDLQSASQLSMLMGITGANGFEHYEISNFARNKQYARHNTNYWKGIPYLGVGPSAHSFNKKSRQWNVANNAKYLHELINHHIPYELELLSHSNRFNEYILTSLRTMWGIDLEKIRVDFGDKIQQKVETMADEYIHRQQLLKANDHLILTIEGKYYADAIASDLFLEDNEF